LLVVSEEQDFVIRQKKLCDFRFPRRSAWYQRSSALFMNFLILEDVTDWLSRNVRKELPLCAA